MTHLVRVMVRVGVRVGVRVSPRGARARARARVSVRRDGAPLRLNVEDELAHLAAALGAGALGRAWLALESDGAGHLERVGHLEALDDLLLHHVRAEEEEPLLLRVDVLGHRAAAQVDRELHRLLLEDGAVVRGLDARDARPG